MLETVKHRKIIQVEAKAKRKNKVRWDFFGDRFQKLFEVKVDRTSFEISWTHLNFPNVKFDLSS